MKVSIAVMFFLFSATCLFAQRDNVSLLVQSPDGKTVKLVWFFKTWNNDITGFDIKRKDGLQDWVKLNTEPILPEVSVKKNLYLVESDKLEESRVKARLYKLLAKNKIQEISNIEYLNRLNSDENAVRDLSDKIARDYDLALINGFGYVDHTVTKKTNYEYGVFIQGTDILLDSVLWNYGQIPDLNAVDQITSKAMPGTNGIQLIWKADLAKMRSGYVAGFNVYREGIRLNSLPVISTGKDPSEYTWNDKSANSSILNQYSISAESLFGIEGIIKSYTYNPEDHPAEYEKAEVTEVTSLGYYFKDGISIKWKFPKEYERFIKGFYVEKDNMPAGYITLTPLLDTSVHTFIDKTPSPVTGYIRFRVNTLYNDNTLVNGIERIYNYFPIREPPAPQSFKAKVLKRDKKIMIYFSWDPTMSGDSITDYYKVYVSDTANDLFYPITNKPIKMNKYFYTIQHGIAATLKFYISSIGKNNAESPTSDTITVVSPSFELPAPKISNLFLDSNKAVVQWQYPDISDLKGFRLYENKNVIANESILKKDILEFKTPVLQGGANYDFTIKAVSDSGVISDFSTPSTISIPKNNRR